MAIQSESFFEAPATNGASRYSNPEVHLFGSPEQAQEFEEETGMYGNPEVGAFGMGEMEGEEELEWGASELSPETGYEFEGETNPFGSPEISPEVSLYQSPEGEFEEEANQLLGFAGESEYEWESELASEADPFFGRIARAARKIGKVVAPLAKRFAPKIVGSLVSMIPGAGAVAPFASQLVSSLMKEAEMEVAQMEHHLTQMFANSEITSETVHPAIQEAALTELLAAEAATAQSEAEAEVSLATALPITITIMGARQPLRRVMPVLTQANARLVQGLHRRGPGGRQLLRTIPTIQRRTISTLGKMAQRGQPISAPLAVKTMAAVTNRVLNNPQLVSSSIQRNAVLRACTAPLTPRRPVAYSPRAAMQHPRVRSSMRPTYMGR